MGIFIKNELTSIVINDYKFTSTSKVEKCLSLQCFDTVGWTAGRASGL